MKYHIRKGKSYCKETWLRFHKGTELRFSVKVDESIITENIHQVNKFFGLSAGLNPLKNSYRLGWRCIDKELYFVLLIHENFKTYKISISKFNIYKTYDVILLLNDSGVVLTIDNKVVKVDCEIKKRKFYILCLPYFENCPKDIEIDITRADKG